jgi:RNA polymerase subunit RPABC4/transcription elongation factor Spt4
MSAEILWGTWKCTKCNADVSGQHRKCTKCGDERDHEELEAIRLDEEAPVVTDAEELRMANLGADWSCKACNVTVREDQEKCPTCGAPKNATADDLIWRAKTRAGDPLERALILDQDGETEGRLALKGQGTKPWWDGALGKAKETAKERPKTLGAVLLVLVGLGVGIFFYRGLRIHAVEGHVSSMSWTQRSERLTWTPVTHSDWQADLVSRPEIPPSDGKGERAGVQITSCSQRRHHDESYVCGHHQEPRPRQVQDGTRTEERTRQVRSGSHQECTKRSRKNGSFEKTCVSVPDYRTERYPVQVPKYRTVVDYVTVTDYCQRPVMRPYCSYQTQEWMQTEIRTESGEGRETKWPALEPKILDKIVRRGEWKVEITYQDGDEMETTTLFPTSEAEYKSWESNEKTHVDVRGFGSVTGVRRWAEMEVP